MPPLSALLLSVAGAVALCFLFLSPLLCVFGACRFVSRARLVCYTRPLPDQRCTVSACIGCGCFCSSLRASAVGQTRLLSHIYRPMPPLSTLLLSVAGAAGAACSALPFREPAPVEGWGPLVFSFFPVCYLLLLSRGIPPPFSCGLPPPFFPWATPPLLFFPLRRPGHMHFPLYLFSDWRD